MLTMTLLAAQNQFSTLIDTAQRQPVSVTRRGRPVAVIQSYEDYQASQLTIPARVAKWISINAPLRGGAASTVIQQHFANMGNKAAEDGLNEADLLRMINAD